MHVLDKMHLLKWTAVFLILHHNLLSTVDGSLRKRVNFQPVVMSSDDVVRYFKSFIGKTSSFAKANEAFYTDDYAEDLYHKIDNLISAQTYMRYLMKTKDITDQTNSKGGSLLAQYQSTLNAPCNPLTIYNQSLDTILRSWDGDKSQMTNMLEDWHMKNHKMLPSEQCNRFKGLTCQYKRALEPDLDQGKSSEISNSTTCQCAQDPANVGFYKSLRRKKEYSELSYPDGCYVRPWRPCGFPSIDPVFKRHYQTWHGDVENEKRILAQMAWPIARVHRCKEDTLCLDMIPGMGKPICWCNPNSLDKACNKAAKNAKFTVPLGATFLNIRKQFARTIIPANDTTSFCHPEHNAKVLLLMKYAGKDPSRTGAMDIMEQLGDPKIKARICDFRNKIICDQQSRTCKGTLDCDEGKIYVGQGVCAVNNGYPCQTSEECVPNAKCKHFNGLLDSACVCQTGYGDQCLLQNPAFFGHKFLPIISGFQEQKFVDLQTEIHATLESWEDTMTLDEGSICDPSEDKKAMELVKWFGSLEEYNKTKGSDMLKSAHQITRDISKSCRYKHFQRCDSITARCVPMHGRKVLSTTTTDVSGDMKIVVEVEPKTECIMEMPKVYHSIVNFVCTRGYFCKRIRDGGYCLPDCDSAFASKKECPETQTALVVVTENFGLGDADLDAQLSTGEDRTTISEVLVPDDGQQNNVIDEIDLEVPPTDSLSSISFPEKEDMSTVALEPENSNNDLDDSSKTRKEFKRDAQIFQEEDTKNDVEEESQADGQEEEKTEVQEETQVEGQEEVQTGGPEGGGNDLEIRVVGSVSERNVTCSPHQIYDPGNPTGCTSCPYGAEPNKTFNPPTFCNCKRGYIPTTKKGPCKRCGIASQIPDPVTLDKCILCEAEKIPDFDVFPPGPPYQCIYCKFSNQIPDPVRRWECKNCSDGQVASMFDRTKCVCADRTLVPDTNGICSECPPGRSPNMFGDFCVCDVSDHVPDKNGVCKPCESNKEPSMNRTSCQCKAGFDPLPGTDTCIECPNGKEPDKDSTSQPPCKCKIGFIPKPSSKECEACEPGSLPDPNNTAVCKPCPAGTVPDLTTKPPICHNCEVDEIINPTNKSSCIACDGDKQPNENRSACICKPGTVPDPDGNDICVTCPDGQIPDGNDTCVSCPAGQIPDLSTASPICKDCEIGEIIDPGNKSSCIACGSDKKPNEDRSACICKPGTVPDSDGNDACVTCPAGQIPDLNDTCTSCPNGTEPDASGLTCICPSDQMPSTDNTTCVCLDETDPISNTCNTSSTTTSSTTTTPSPAPPPAPTPPSRLPHGSPCFNDSECADPFFCREKRCQCLRGLWNIQNKCVIPLDHQCDDEAIQSLAASNPGYNTKHATCSFGAKCTQINRKGFCRSIEDNGYIVMSESNFRKIKRNEGSALKSGLNWNQLGGLVIPLTLAVLKVVPFLTD